MPEELWEARIEAVEEEEECSLEDFSDEDLKEELESRGYTVCEKKW